LAFLSGYVQYLKRDHPNTIVVAAGDLVGASPLVSALFHDEPTIEALNRLGLELSSVGNHEFDAGRTELQRKQHGGCHPGGANTCQGQNVGTPVPFEGAHFQYLAANIVDATSGAPIFPAYAIRRFDGVKVGFIGMTLAGTPTIVTPTGVAGLRFLDEAETVNALIPQLHAQGVNAIVVLIHQGGFQAPDAPGEPAGINDFAGQLQGDAISPIRDIVRRIDDGVDLVISGHSHKAYNCQLPNRVGRPVPVTQAASFGRVITSVDLTLDRASGRVTGASARNWVVDRSNPGVAPDARIAELIQNYATLAAPLDNRVIGRIAAAISVTASNAGELPAGDLIADAQLHATAPADLGGAQMAFMNSGGVRGTGMVAGPFPHDVTYGEAFTLQPFGNSLVVMDLTAGQIRDLLEQQFPGCEGQTVAHILQLSRGLLERWSTGAAACHHVVDFQILQGGNAETIVSAGRVADPAKVYRVTVNSFLSTGGDGFTVLKAGAHTLGGAQDIDALVAYLSAFQAPSAPYDIGASALGSPRIVRLP
jgi:5'-nucleotidase